MSPVSFLSHISHERHKGQIPLLHPIYRLGNKRNNKDTIIRNHKKGLQQSDRRNRDGKKEDPAGLYRRESQSLHMFLLYTKPQIPDLGQVST